MSPPVAHPLCWPEGVDRTRVLSSSAFKATLATALKNVQDALRRFGSDTTKPISNIILSSNVTLAVNSPADAGVAAWFVWEGQQRCIAVDRYPKVQDNLQAIYHIIEARRTEMRHGGLRIVRQTFAGFTALPAPAQTWRGPLGIEVGSPSRELVQIAYREQSKKAAGDEDRQRELNLARDAALKEIGA